MKLIVVDEQDDQPDTLEEVIQSMWSCFSSPTKPHTSVLFQLPQRMNDKSECALQSKFANVGINGMELSDQTLLDQSGRFHYSASHVCGVEARCELKPLWSIERRRPRHV